MKLTEKRNIKIIHYSRSDLPGYDPESLDTEKNLHLKTETQAAVSKMNIMKTDLQPIETANKWSEQVVDDDYDWSEHILDDDYEWKEPAGSPIFTTEHVQVPVPVVQNVYHEQDYNDIDYSSGALVHFQASHLLH